MNEKQTKICRRKYVCNTVEKFIGLGKKNVKQRIEMSRYIYEKCNGGGSTGGGLK